MLPEVCRDPRNLAVRNKPAELKANRQFPQNDIILKAYLSCL